MIRFALHGGAGDPRPGGETQESEQRRALREIAREAAASLQAGASALDVVELAVVRLEECPLFNAGIGAVLTRDGQPELDAAIMDGASRQAGAVAGISRMRNPIRLARAVMERSPHVLLVGAGAEALGRECGLEAVEPEWFVTPQRQRQLRAAQARDAIALDHDSAFGTVGAVALDTAGHLAAATSTGGLTNKRAGRVGDTPLPGAGTYADDRSVAVSCTGTGESFIRAVFAHQVHARCLYAGATLSQACAAALQDAATLGGRGGCIAIDRAGNVALPFNARAMYRAWLGDDGAVNVAVGAQP